MRETEWTNSGLRIHVEAVPTGMIVLTCQSQTISGTVGKVGRGKSWALSQLGIPVLTTRSEAHRVIKHWLAYYGDETLIEKGLAAFHDEFLAVPEFEDPPEGQAGGQGMKN